MHLTLLAPSASVYEFTIQVPDGTDFMEEGYSSLQPDVNGNKCWLWLISLRRNTSFHPSLQTCRYLRSTATTIMNLPFGPGYSTHSQRMVSRPEGKQGFLPSTKTLMNVASIDNLKAAFESLSTIVVNEKDLPPPPPKDHDGYLSVQIDIPASFVGARITQSDNASVKSNATSSSILRRTTPSTTPTSEADYRAIYGPSAVPLFPNAITPIIEHGVDAMDTDETQDQLEQSSSIGAVSTNAVEHLDLRQQIDQLTEQLAQANAVAVQLEGISYDLAALRREYTGVQMQLADAQHTISDLERTVEHKESSTRLLRKRDRDVPQGMLKLLPTMLLLLLLHTLSLLILLFTTTLLLSLTAHLSSLFCLYRRECPTGGPGHGNLGSARSSSKNSNISSGFTSSSGSSSNSMSLRVRKIVTMDAITTPRLPVRQLTISAYPKAPATTLSLIPWQQQQLS